MDDAAGIARRGDQCYLLHILIDYPDLDCALIRGNWKGFGGLLGGEAECFFDKRLH